MMYRLFWTSYSTCQLISSRPFIFSLQFIGWQEVPRPSSRTEIVSAMRRIRVSRERGTEEKRVDGFTTPKDPIIPHRTKPKETSISVAK